LKASISIIYSIITALLCTYVSWWPERTAFVVFLDDGASDRNANDYYSAGHPAARIEFTAKQFNPITGETQQRMVSLASIINGKGYSIAASAPDSKFSDFAAQFGHMLYSFSVNG
jgi:hypothetical protein